ncbi:hypothetical protein [Polaribacter sp. R77954]|uniref:hypothetical protein n=1 Tax=Polaribacter sp. R77954 TaxID=3093870 RepID=UPI0037CC23B4
MNKDKIGIIVIFTIIISIVIYGFSREKELSELGIHTNGKITEYFYVGAKNYVKYTFKVGNKNYYGEQRVYPFKCENGIYGCVGKEFEIIYSSENPKNNEINLGEYNKYKPNRIKMFETEKESKVE